MATFGALLESLLPEAAERLLERVLGPTMPHDGPGGHYRIALAGRFDGRFGADLLLFVQNHAKDAALVLGDPDSVRVLYFLGGSVVGSDSDVIFERLGRTLLRAGRVSEDVARSVQEAEESMGTRVASALLPPDTLRFGLERRTREIGAALPFLREAHFLVVAGKPDLGSLPHLSIGVMDLVIEGVRKYDEWRHGRANGTARAPGDAGVSGGRPRDRQAPPGLPPRRGHATSAAPGSH